MITTLRFPTTVLLFLVFFFAGCTNFRNLRHNLDFMEKTMVIAGEITNASDYGNVWVSIANWQPDQQKINSADFTKINKIGNFAFFAEKSDNQYLCAFSDRNGNKLYEEGEPSWIHSNSNGQPIPVSSDPNGAKDIIGRLSSKTVLPKNLIADARKWAAGRNPDKIRTGWDIPVEFGEVVSIDEARFSSKKGAEGYWQPVKFPKETGIGIFFLEEYDPKRKPVIFVFGAAGSPQDWKSFFQEFDREHFQLWFYEYPTGLRLAEVGDGFELGIESLRSYYQFDKVDIVAHSMGGLVSRYAILQNLSRGSACIDRFVTISSPFGGVASSVSGVKHAPSAIPSWYDMVPDSDFQKGIFKSKLKGRVDYMLLYGDKGRRSLLLPPENDGTVGVPSVTRKEAVKDAIKVQRFHEDHMSILSNPEVIQIVEDFLRD